MKKGEKGITLVALIITIVVLLILAVVTITAVNEGGIFAHANNATTKYNAAATEENSIVSNYLSEMKKHDKGVQNPPADPSDITGTYYAADGSDTYSVVITENTLIFFGEKVQYNNSNNTITCTIMGTPLSFNYSTLEDGTKVLYLGPSYGAPILYATDISKLRTGILTGKYINSERTTEYYEFLNANSCKYYEKSGDQGEDCLYTYFTDQNVIKIDENWFKLEGNIMTKSGDAGWSTEYIKQN